jgi:hypothetical protein
MGCLRKNPYWLSLDSTVSDSTLQPAWCSVPDVPPHWIQWSEMLRPASRYWHFTLILEQHPISHQDFTSHLDKGILYYFNRRLRSQVIDPGELNLFNFGRRSPQSLNQLTFLIIHDTKNQNFFSGAQQVKLPRYSVPFVLVLTFVTSRSQKCSLLACCKQVNQLKFEPKKKRSHVPSLSEPSERW